MTVEEPSHSHRDAASFRDPSGYVFRRHDRIFRAIDGPCRSIIQELITSGLFPQLIEDGLLVGTRFAEEELARSLSREHPGYDQFLEHDCIAPITYPYEWSCSMLADAAIHTLDLQMRLLKSGYSLKDASAYNIQFVDGKPVFIDVASVQRPARLDVWRALGQFGQMFTFPILLFRYHGWDLRSYFLANVNGRDVEQVERSLGRFQRWLPRYLLDVTLPAILNRRARRRAANSGNMLEQENKNAEPQLVNLQRLRRKIRRLATGYRPRSVWADYQRTHSYDNQAKGAKQALVRDYLELVQPSSVLDAGCNTGEFAYLAADCGARVIAADSDHDAVELLARRLKDRPAPITPVVLDLCNPSPPIGHLNCERPGSLERHHADCLLALALVHHLRVNGNLPLPSIRDLFLKLTKHHLILEFVPTDDEMFRCLTTFRIESYNDFTLDACRAVFSERFELLREDTISGSLRTLMLFRKP